jgi:hypothetical protein
MVSIPTILHTAKNATLMYTTDARESTTNAQFAIAAGVH